MRIQFFSYFWNLLIKQTQKMLSNPPNTFLGVSILQKLSVFAYLSLYKNHSSISVSRCNSSIEQPSFKAAARTNILLSVGSHNSRSLTWLVSGSKPKTTDFLIDGRRSAIGGLRLGDQKEQEISYELVIIFKQNFQCALLRVTAVKAWTILTYILTG